MKLRLKGFKGIKATPLLDWSGMDEIEIDFTGRHGLTGFVGKCGSGKSTVLECLHHYPQLVSRDGALWQHVLLRNSEKEFESEFMGDRYRSLIKIDAQSQKTEGYLWVNGKPVVNGKISAYKEHVNKIFGQPFTYFRSQFCPQKRRKTKDMQLENMTAGVFKELLTEFLNLQQYTEKGEKAKQCGSAIAAQLTQLSSRIDALQERIKGLEELRAAYSQEMSKAEELDARKKGMLDSLSELRLQAGSTKEIIAQNAIQEQRRADLGAQIDKAKSALEEERKAAAAERQVLADKYKELKPELDKINAILVDKDAVLNASKKEKELQEEIDKLAPELEQLGDELAKHQETVHTLELDIRSLEASIRNLDSDNELKEINEEISRLDSQITENSHSLEMTTKDIEGKIRDLDSDPTTKDVSTELASILASIATHNQEVKDLDNDMDLQRMKLEIDNLSARAAERDCYECTPGEKCQSTTCVAVAAASKAERDLPEAKAKYTSRLNAIEEKKASICSTIDTLTTKRTDAEGRLATRKEEVADERKRLLDLIEGSRKLTQSAIDDLNAKKDQSTARKAARAKKIAEEKGLISKDIDEKKSVASAERDVITQKSSSQTTARQKLATLRHEIAKQRTLAEKLNDITTAASRKEDLDRQISEVCDQGTAKKEAWQTKEAAATAAIESLQKSLSEVEKAIDKDACDRLKAIEEAISRTEKTDLPAVETEITAIRESLAAMQTNIASGEAAEKELVEAKAEKESFAKEVAEWAFLRNAVGKDIPATEIEGAAPQIIADANELLNSTYGSYCSVKLKTFDEATGKECLEVKIIPENGQEIDLDDISGGQCVWNIQALWLAMSLLNQKKSSRQFDYFGADEQDGALDVENARKFAALYRPFMQIGGFKDLFFISHKPECQALADNILLFDGGKNPVWG
jgi:DNA repair exonuclease SbcCD ATPase subunit